MLARVAQQAFRWNPAEDVRVELAREDRSREFARVHCAPLTDEERIAAERSFGCYAFGSVEQTLTLGGRLVAFGPRGIALVGTAEGDRLRFGCPVVPPQARTWSLEPPDDAAPGVGARHFVGVFMWQHMRRAPDDRGTYVLEWAAYEVQGDEVNEVARALLASRDSRPSPAYPSDLERRVSLEMIRSGSGHVRWKIESAPPARGWIMLPEVRR